MGGSNAFTGILDGNGGLGANYALSGATITGGDVGLFATNTGTIRNLTISNFQQTGTSYNSLGVLVDNNYGLLSNDAVVGGSISGNAYEGNVAGLVGHNAGTILNSSSSASVTANSSGSYGGLVGWEDAGR